MYVFMEKMTFDEVENLGCKNVLFIIIMIIVIIMKYQNIVVKMKNRIVIVGVVPIIEYN